MFSDDISLEIGEGGKVRVYDFESAMFIRLWPIDARQQLEAGLVSLVEPSEWPTGEKPKVAAADDDEVDLREFKLDELRGFARDLKLANYRKMRKADLAEALSRAGLTANTSKRGTKCH